MQGPYLLTDKAEASVRPLTLVGLPQDRVEGLAARSVVRGGIGGDSKGCNVHLQEQGQGECHWGWWGPKKENPPTASKDWGPGLELRQQGNGPARMSWEAASRSWKRQPAWAEGGWGPVPCARRGR